MFIVIGGDLYGYWGIGSTIEAARKAWRKAGGRRRAAGYHEYRFDSELPFAPSNRTATDSESDAWVGRDGSINWVRCTKVDLV